MLHVVLDANSVGIRAPLAGNPQRLLIEAAAKGQIVLVVPELVVREVVNKWREFVDKEVDRLAAPVRELEKYEISVPVPSAAELEDLAAGVESSLRAALSGAGIVVAGFPRTSHEFVVSRALARRQPFDGAGKDGYRDVLLWETVVDLARDHEVVLVSRDARAFADADGTLARVLAKEVEERTGAPARVELSKDPHEIVERLAEQDRAVLDKVTQLSRLRSFRVIFEEQFEDAIAFATLDPLERERLAPVSSVWEPRVWQLQEMGTITAVSAYTVPSGEALVQFDVQCGVVATFQALESETYSLSSDVADSISPSFGFEPLPADRVLMAAHRLAHARVDAAIALPAGRIERVTVLRVTLAPEDEEFEEPAVTDDDPWVEDDENEREL
jgi:hypothetical protein